jgi:hypothetical protein
VKFATNEYKPIYIGHIKSLELFGEETKQKDLLGKLQCELYNIGWYIDASDTVFSGNARPDRLEGEENNKNPKPKHQNS